MFAFGPRSIVAAKVPCDKPANRRACRHAIVSRLGIRRERASMKRREFIAGAGSAVVWAAASSAQEGRIAKIGILALGHPDPAPLLKSLRQGLRVLGYEDG